MRNPEAKLVLQWEQDEKDADGRQRVVSDEHKQHREDENCLKHARPQELQRRNRIGDLATVFGNLCIVGTFVASSFRTLLAGQCRY